MGFMGSTMAAVGGLGGGRGQSSIGRPTGAPFAGIGAPPPAPSFSATSGTAGGGSGTGTPANPWQAAAGGAFGGAPQLQHPFITHLMNNPGLLQTLAKQFGPLPFKPGSYQSSGIPGTGPTTGGTY